MVAITDPALELAAFKLANETLWGALRAVLDGTAQIDRDENGEVVRVSWASADGECVDSIDWTG